MFRRCACLLLLLSGLPAAAGAQTIASFAPAAGNVGTLVALTGTDLDRVTAVAVNGTPGVLLDQTATSLHLLVMPGATSGAFATTGGTPTRSATAFTVTGTALDPAQQGPKLVGTGVVGSAYQGSAVALSADGHTLAVGGYADDHHAGAVWVFARTGAGWRQQGPKLVGAGAAGPFVQQGFSVALSADGHTLAVGANEDDTRRGAVWVFARTGADWAQQGPKLVGTGAAGPGAQQGSAVALSADGHTLAVGGRQDTNGAGAVWVFARTGADWAQQGPKLVGRGAAGPGAQQGFSVALSADGTTLAAGGHGDSTSIGAVWVFARTGADWAQQGPKLVGTGAVGPTVLQGAAVALSADGHTLAVGADADDTRRGATWVFARTGAGWRQQGPKLVGDGAVGRVLIGQGHAVALSADGTTLAVGGHGDNANAGATWVFARTGAGWREQGPKLVGAGFAGPDASQGFGVALSADGTTLAVGGIGDGSTTGATWVFSAARGPLAARAAAGPGGARFFPNPVSEQLTVTGGARSGPLRLFDAGGRTRLTGTYRDGQPLDLSALPAGFYWLQLDQGPARPLLKR